MGHVSPGRSDFNGAATQRTYDANGNLTGDETGRQFVYDAWNRLVTVKDSGGSTISSYQYDGLGRRIFETKSGTTTDLYLSTADQVLEERVSGTATAQYVWSPVYVDALVLRDRDTDANGLLDERRWVQQDANWNVTALLDNSGAVVERYAYDPYGNFTIYDASWTSRSSSSYGWVYQHQGLRYDGGAGLYHARARDLSPSLGRWLQNDPAGFGAGDADLYRAYGNGPTGAVDPNGRNWFDRWADDFVRGLDVLTGGASTSFLADDSTRFAQVVKAEDQFFAGWANNLTFGASNWAREQMWGQTATQNHSGLWYDAGMIFGGYHQLAMALADPGAAWASIPAQLYADFSLGYYGGRGAINIANGNGKPQDYLDLILALIGVFGRVKNICNAANKIPPEQPPFDPKGTVGAAKAWTMSQRLKQAQLPTRG